MHHILTTDLHFLYSFLILISAPFCVKGTYVFVFEQQRCREPPCMGSLQAFSPAQEKIPNHRMQKTHEKAWKEQGNLPDPHVTKVQDYK